MWRATLTRWALVLTAAALLDGCGRNSEPKSYRLAHRPIDAAAAAAEADLVSAVSPAGSVGPVGLKFKVPEPPRVGQLLRLELVLAQEPGLDISHMLVSLQASDGLLLESDRSVEFEAPATGATQRMVVSVRAEQEGLLRLNATVLVDAGNTSLTRSFSIPLIAAP
jgi:hypothetical protein